MVFIKLPALPPRFHSILAAHHFLSVRVPAKALAKGRRKAGCYKKSKKMID